METWHEQLPEDLRGDETLASIPDLETLARSHIDAQKHIGGSIRIPSEDAGEQDWADFNAKLTSKLPSLINLSDDPEAAKATLYERLGVPKDAEGYTAEGLDQGFREFALANGFTNDQVAALLTKVNEDNAAAAEMAEAAGTEATNGLKAEWGHAYDQKLAEANKAITAFGGEEGMAFATESGLIKNPAFLKMMANAGANLGEEAAGSIPNGGSLKLSPEEARNQISEIKNAARQAYERGESHPYNRGDRDMVAKMARLHEQAFPS